MLDAAIRYVERGWAVIPVTAGRRRPIETDWPNRLARDAAAVRQFWAWYPHANVGIATGAPSGLWVLDVDPQNGGDVALAGLVQAYGQLPETYIVRTGGGGVHYYFDLPDFEPRNQQNGGSLPDGLDVRGWHGQVVAPPSVSEKGEYSILHDVPVIAPAPGWLVEMIRPPIIAEREIVDAPMGELAGSPTDRGAAYAAKAIEALVGNLAAMTQGGRNAAAFRAACRLLELANASWSGLSVEHARQAFDWACRANGLDVDSPVGQPDAAWRQAERRVGAQPAELPPTAMYGVAMDFYAPPLQLSAAAVDFSSPATATAGPVVVDLVAPDAGDWMGPRAGAVSQAGQAAAMATMADRVELAVQQRLQALQIDREARRRLDDRPRRDWALAAMDDAAIEALDDPASLVGGWLWMDSLARVYGPSGGGKSFAVMDMGLCVAHDLPWHGEPVAAGAVSYVAGEGLRGLKKRRRAWLKAHQLDKLDDRFKVYPAMPSLTDERDWSAFVEEQQRRQAVLVTFDTQAHLTAGLDENSKADSDVLVSRIIQLREATGACVLLVHHTGKDESAGGRGHSSVKGALDSEIEVRRGGMTVTITSQKQKDGQDPPKRLATMTPVPDTGSLVLVYSGDPGTLGADQAVGGAAVFDTATGELKMPDKQSATQDRSEWITRQVVQLLRSEASEGNGITRAELAAAWRLLPINRGADGQVAARQVRRAVARLDELQRLGKTDGQRFCFREVPGLGDLDLHPDGQPMGFGRPAATKEDQRRKR